MNEMMTRDEMVQKHEAMMAAVMAQYGAALMQLATESHPGAGAAVHGFVRDQMVRTMVAIRLAK